MSIHWNNVPGAALLAAALAIGTCPSALADDFFAGRMPRAIKEDSLVAPGTTIGGYPLFHADGNWRLQSSSVAGPNNMNVFYGTVHLYRQMEGKFFADMQVTVNLNDSGEDFSLRKDICLGEHLVTVEASTGDDCMTIDPVVLRVGSRQVTAVLINIRNSRFGRRFYHMRLRIDPASLGVRVLPRSPSDKAYSEDPALRSFIERLTAWARQLQRATGNAIGYEKPADAYTAVPSWWDLKLEPATR